MKDSLYHRLWRRECGEQSQYAGLRGIYGSREWVDNLDIVNELGGHTGCVNALSWSRSGRLLASGSDDQYLNIYSYQPESSNSQFALNTTVFTGHKANIFSVKFMPHSNDGTLVTCAADSTVRVFDIEYSRGKPGVDPSGWEASVRSRRFSEFFTGARYLSDGNTNTRVYRSHADRVKRIVTESSPYLFLTCSEDGEVRQWDLRLPSSAYPPPRGGQGFMSYRPGRQHDDSNVPPPLISYKQYNLDLNTISCSPSQPHYIALGGAHMHCFLHDRRMIGPDRSAARGSATPSAGSVADEEMSKATRCVRRFAPGGKHRVKHAADGHITACKISDANPDEIIVSWSGDHIYSFDLIRGPDAREGRSEKATLKGKNTRARRSSKSRKRKRQKPTTPSSQESGGPQHSRFRSEDLDTFSSDETGEEEHIDSYPPYDGPVPTTAESILEQARFAVLNDAQHSRFRSEDLDTFSSDETGEEEHIDSYPPYDGPVPTTAESILEQARFAVLNDAQRLSMQIAKGLVKLRRNLFSLEATVQEALRTPGVTPASYADFFASTLEMAEDYLPTMEEVMRQWRYPLNPSQDTVNFQMSLRHNRESAWRFVQASGAISYALSNRPIDVESVFQSIQPAPGEEEIPPGSKFGYEFLRAILLWLQHGRARLLEGFQRRNAPRRSHDRYPIPDESEEDAIETILIPYLMDMARDTPVVNLDASSQNNSARNLFPTQLAAVATFGRVVRLPLEDLGDPAARVERRRASNVRCLDRDCSKRFWVLRVGRSLLMEAAKGVNYMFVNHAFGGMRALPESSGSESDVEIEQADIEPNAEEEGNSNVNLVLDGRAPQQADAESESSREEAKSSNAVANRGEGGSDDSQAEDDSSDDEEDDDDDVDEWPLGSSDDEDNAEYDSDDTTTSNYAIPRVRQRDVERHAPCSTHIRSYRGHCNIKTVKDVNFFGLNDEYVVSGSDSGHIFIWDRKTSHLVNILEGDSDIVNVVQGHPYEPMIAASGIDNTIKIFSSDQNAQEDARNGINILDPDNPSNTLGRNTSIGGLESRKRIHESYRIMSQNDVERRGGMNEAQITREMLGRLAANLRDRRGVLGTGMEGLEAPGEHATVVLDDNCSVM